MVLEEKTSRRIIYFAGQAMREISQDARCPHHRQSFHGRAEPLAIRGETDPPAHREVLLHNDNPIAAARPIGRCWLIGGSRHVELICTIRLPIGR